MVRSVKVVMRLLEPYHSYQIGKQYVRANMLMVKRIHNLLFVSCHLSRGSAISPIPKVELIVVLVAALNAEICDREQVL